MQRRDLQVGDRVKKSPMWKYESAEGTVTKVTKDYVVIRWDGVNGDWHYTESQARKISLITGDQFMCKVDDDML